MILIFLWPLGPLRPTRALARRFLISEVLVGDPKQRAAADVLVELAPMHPDLAGGLLSRGHAENYKY